MHPTFWKLSPLWAALALVVSGLAVVAAAEPAPLQVTRQDDRTPPQPCSPDPAGCTLREAVIAANARPGANSIVLPAGTFSLTIPNNGKGDATARLGDLDITDTVTITGAGAEATIIQAGALFDDRIFEIVSSTTSMSGVTVRGARTDRVDIYGGGVIVATAATLRLVDSTISDNKAVYGGGLANNGSLTILRGTISANGAHVTSGNGGAINNRGSLAVIDSTLSGNQGAFGGAIFNSGSLTITNSTISGNTASGDGGGIFNEETLSVNNGTIAFNEADSDLAGYGGTGGGIYQYDKAGSTTLRNTILYGNMDSVEVPLVGRIAIVSECSGLILSVVATLVQLVNTDRCTLTGPVVQPAAGLLLAPLADNGGPTLTHALAAASPARDAGFPGGCRDDTGQLITADQRGYLRPAGAACDIGAYEFGAAPPAPSSAPTPTPRSYTIRLPLAQR